MVAVDEQEDVLADGEGATEPTMTLQRWRRFVDTPPASFTLFSEQKWEGLDHDAREAYDDSRISYHSEMVIVATSLLKDVARQGRLLTLLNRRETGARRMLILSGLQTTGKTTALKQLGRTHELRLRDGMPGRATDRIPVVYVSTPPKGSPRKLAAEFGRFLGLPRPSGPTTPPT
jgi:AAA domain